jgi:hypothetical protein
MNTNICLCSILLKIGMCIPKAFGTREYKIEEYMKETKAKGYW